jgi:hypothetical protein
MLLRLADHELRCAEAARERQRPYRSPDRWSRSELTASTYRREIEARQREWHEFRMRNLRLLRARDPTTLEMYGRFEPRYPEDNELQRFNPSRTIATLERRGLVAHDHRSIALTAEGFALARRLGLRDSAVVDLDRVQAAWRDPDDFMLWDHWHRSVLLCEDGPPRDAGRLVVNKLYPD